MSFNRIVYKHTVGHLYNGILFIIKIQYAAVKDMKDSSLHVAKRR